MPHRLFVIACSARETSPAPLSPLRAECRAAGFQLRCRLASATRRSRCCRRPQYWCRSSRSWRRHRQVSLIRGFRSPCRDDHRTTDTERPSGPLPLEAPCLTSRCRSTASARPPDEAVAIFTDRRRPRNGGLASKSRKGRGLFTPRCGSATLPFDCRNSRSKLLNPFAVPDASRLGRRSGACA